MLDHHSEIELRFLVRGESWKTSARAVKIEQRYISLNPDRSVRIRRSGNRGFLTIKGSRQHNVNLEYEWPIPSDQALDMFKHPQLFEGYPIVKNRYTIPENRFTWKERNLEWHIDEFLDENYPLCIAEIELVDIKTEAEKAALTNLILESLPKWVGYQINADQHPDEARYHNVHLAKRPVSQKKKKKKKQLMDRILKV